MSRSYRSTHAGSSHSRRSRAPADELLVTQAGLQSLQLSPSSGSHSFPDHLSSYPHYPQADPSVSYLQSSYDICSFPGQAFQGAFAEPSQSLIDPRSVTYSPQLVPSPMPGSNMPFGYSQSHLSQGGQRTTYDQSQQSMPEYLSHGRSMFGSSGPSLASSWALSTSSPEDSRIARRRRRGSQETRHQSKVIVRRTRARLPSNVDAGLGSTQVVSGSVDFLAAAPVPSSYGHVSSSRPYSQLPQISSAQGGYEQAPSRPPSHFGHSAYSISNTTGTVNSPSYIYSSSPGYPPSLSTTNHPSYVSDRGPVAIAVSPRSEGVRVVSATRERPQCWDHGCSGREFSTFSNLLRHQREKDGTATKSSCPNCGAEFTRTTARNGHIEQGKCKPRRSSGE